MPHSWTPEDEDRLTILYQGGLTDQAIADQLREEGTIPTATRKSVELKRTALGLRRDPSITTIETGKRRAQMDEGITGGDRFQKLMLPTSPNDRIMVISDTQIPFHDSKSVDAVERFMDDFQPHKIIWNGDIADFYGLSRYDKNPKRAASIQDELDIAHRMQERHAKRFPTATRVWVLGNHEDRLRRHLWEHPGLSSLRSLDTESVFTRDKMFTILPYGSHVQINGTRIEHGGPVRGKAGYSARALFEKRGTSVIMGHTHRLSQSSHRNALGQHTMIEGGCLCDLSPEYGEEPDWTQGFVYGYVNNGSTHWYTVPILVDGFRAEGRFYRRERHT